jgi:putative methionine-R-sulfoxide reductase with GAF domain
LHRISAAAAQRQQQQQLQLLAVLDVDSNHAAAFNEVGAQHLEELCNWLANKYSSTPH